MGLPVQVSSLTFMERCHRPTESKVHYLSLMEGCNKPADPSRFSAGLCPSGGRYSGMMAVVAGSTRLKLPRFGITNLDRLPRSGITMGSVATFRYNYGIGYHVPVLGVTSAFV
uniref:Uncharacterized protein n=1 Tax=Solanum tuberosum TaxID=4113 RepID=M1DDV2_SOLTU